MLAVYRIATTIYFNLIKLAALWNKKAALFVAGRKNWQKELPSFPNAKVAWFHCASLGEFEQGRPLIEKFRKEYPEWKIALTFFSPSGFEIRKNYPSADWVGYMPLDSPANAKFFLDKIQPSLAFFVKYEFWYHYLSELKKRQIPTIGFSMIFRPSQLFFKSYGGFYRNMLFGFQHIFVQDERSKALLSSIGFNAVTIGGDTRFDRVLFVAETAQKYPKLEKFIAAKPNAKVLMVGSAWPKDMEVLFRAANKFIDKTQLIVAPHEMDASFLEYLQREFKGKTAFYSKATELELSTADMLVIDSIGFLNELYQYADVAWIGGGFSKGIHNVLEASVYKIPVVFGPNYHKSREANDLLANGAATYVGIGSEADAVFNQLLFKEGAKESFGAKAIAYVNANAGATQKVLDFLSSLIGK